MSTNRKLEELFTKAEETNRIAQLKLVYISLLKHKLSVEQVRKVHNTYTVFVIDGYYYIPEGGYGDSVSCFILSPPKINYK